MGGAHVRNVLHHFGDVVGKVAHMRLAAAARHGQRAVFDDVKHGAGHVDDLAPLGYLGLLQRQRMHCGGNG